MSSSKDAELGLIAALLFDPSSSPDVAEIARAEDFQDPKLSAIADTIYRLGSTGADVSLASIIAEMKAVGTLAMVGGDLALVDYGTAISFTKAAHYAGLVRRASTLRALERTCRAVAGEAESTSIASEGAVTELLRGAEASIFNLSTAGAGKAKMLTVEESIFALVRDAENPKPDDGHKTGFADLDSLVHKVRPTEFMLIAARPGVGKTTMGLNIMANMVAEGAKVLFASLEMSSSEVFERIMSRKAKIESFKFRSGTFSLDDREKVFSVQDEMRAWQFRIIDDSSPSVGRIASHARRSSIQMGGLDCIIVDYIQLMSDPGSKGANRNDTIGAVSRGLKALAMEMKVSVIAMAQLSRGVQDGEQPGLHHLRESGSLEADANRVLMMWRKNGAVTARLEKNRSGATGPVYLAFDPRYFDFRNGIQGTDESASINPTPDQRSSYTPRGSW